METSDTAAGLRVTVIGAGLGGMCAAIALHDIGAEVTVYQQASEFGDVGGGNQLVPGGLAFGAKQ